MESLNKQQYKASRPDRGISLVIAGAGTGKTKTLVEKVNNIIRKGDINPSNILILTFSRKAAEEIRERIRMVIGDDANNITSGTFHSFCLGFLRENGKAFLENEGFKAFPNVVDDDERGELLYKLIKESLDEFMGLPIDVVKYLLESYERLNKQIRGRLTKAGITDRIYELRKKFSQIKRERNYIDFGDMLDYCIRLLERDDDIRHNVNRRFRYILIDEFQDTSENNFRLIKLILPVCDPNLFVVGDDWQSIYGFRNARVEYIVKMRRYFPDVNIYKLRINYRSRKEIVLISNRFIKKNRFRTRKRIRSYNGRGGIITGIKVDDFRGEIRSIRSILKDEMNNNEEIAILCRNNWQRNLIIKNLDELRGDKKIKLMTIHASKGLEFHTVIVAGVSDEIIPDRSTDIEEERRLFYVALTRAKESLYIIYHTTRRGKIPRFAGELGFSDGK